MQSESNSPSHPTGSFVEFLPMLQLFRQEYTPSTLPYHFVVPSLPGYTFSSGPPLDRNFTTNDVARVLDQLMQVLGFESGYIAQGGDIGSRIARILGVDYASCKGMSYSSIWSIPLRYVILASLLTLLKLCTVSVSSSQDSHGLYQLSTVNVAFMARPAGITDDHLSAAEKRGLERYNNFVKLGSGYMMEHGTRPSTIGLVLSTNPVALLAWFVHGSPKYSVYLHSG